MAPASHHRQWQRRPPKMGSGCSSGDIGAGRGRRRRRMGEIMGQKNEERRGARMKISVITDISIL